MTPFEFCTALDATGLRQVDFQRILTHLSGQPADAGTINRWAKGRRAVPPTVAALLNVWQMLPEAKRRDILEDSA